MKITETEVAAVLALASADHWENGLPVVRAKLRLAVNSLREQCMGNLPMQDPKKFTDLLRMPRNSGIRKILANCETRAFAFALRDALK